MKKKILFLLILFLPFMIDASEKCNIISGNGKDIGSEIACGTEHFYVIEDKEDSVRMLAKYNLDIGYEFNKVTVSEERYNEIKELCLGSSRCDLLLNEKEFSGYNYIMNYFINDDNTCTYMIYKIIQYDEVKQSSKAIGAHGDKKGSPEFPEYGIISGFPVNGQIGNLNREDIYEDYYIDFSVEKINFYDNMKFESEFYLNDYIEQLKTKSFDVTDSDLISVNELNNIVYAITDNELPLKDWGENEWEKIDDKEHEHEYYIVGNVKEYLPRGYEWLYSTTYWLKTALPNYYYDNSFRDDTPDIYFIDTLGNLCNAYACEISVGAGIRPVVEISKESINYNLTTASDKGGSLETDKSHLVGDTIILNAVAETGYKLAKLIVTTDSGISIEIENEDIIKNTDGTISINPDKFVMPLENVHIEAKWEFVNPKTGIIDFITIIFIGLLMSFCGFIIVKRYNEQYEI